MSIIMPVGASFGSGSMLPAQALDATSGAAAPASMAASSSVTSVVMIQQQIEAFLGNVDPALSSNQSLKMLIALLVLNALLGQDSGASQSGGGILPALNALGSNRSDGLYLGLESSTNTVQIQQTSVRLETSEAVQLLGAADKGQDAAGGSVDVSA